ncbi:mannose-1-phosphate guanylyltransferase/mannose-6-phosphate isomerase [Yersinia kristensenii]|uniref:mannose-1-phosphate guanylyltransferase/mannose-6-phosphate isomerase n=1 Tax=Yersinia kristensenii TaxID=28152 RepID=UPI00119F4CE0|nr:mannose-1-phosphate guanylyltransferase/mannose-6-phosphate isomerase [Yersinia kristensenii]MBW5812747.1 mannose-1-phosphate guanylyltransferase/mannose-6-phosphate isomerase [Yersinia kristensenii]MBW5825304.1 mannose-1-phosphate guanylyltransferase/mannose-6-phosphate isomerase [Yersinia kristensenii]MBW5829952.1 mannose-1-phosphate guanylyltransferase/mannose-6-phosphate isomerase [Yersinia kristensenii]
MLLPVIMAGGTGSRLWPLSRTLYPKQFLALTSELTMLQETLTRLDGISHQPALIICNEEHRFIIAEQLRQLHIEHSGIVLEPVGRSTAPAIALAALLARSRGEDPLLLVLAADHVIQNRTTFIDSIINALPLAEAGKLVTFGIIPDAPESGYGYICRGMNVGNNAYKVDAFVEKPDQSTAEKFIASGGYYWNSGMFIFKASRYLQELELYRPEIFASCKKAIDGCRNDLDFIRLNEEPFLNCPEDSIDYAVMEKTSDAVVVPMDAKWSDVGSWSALWALNEKDDNGNVIRGDVLIEDTNDSYIYSKNKLVATVGVNDLIIVETKDAILVAHKDKVQDVKSIVAQLKKNGRTEHLQHREVYRPWGSHDSIAEGERYHVKHVIVRPGQRTAMQIHHHRAEHWVVVSGTAKVYRGDEVFLVTENESTYIPVGLAHAIENPGKFDLEIIEVRSGSYLREDDIVRIDHKNAGY